MAKRTVYAASRGSYSDYEVMALFENEEDASRLVALNVAEYVEEFDLYDGAAEVHTAYSFSIQKANGRSHEYSEGRLEAVKHEFSDTDWHVWARGPDRERVVKSVSDRYAQWLAAKEGVA